MDGAFAALAGDEAAGAEIGLLLCQRGQERAAVGGRGGEHLAGRRGAHHPKSDLKLETQDDEPK